MRKKDLLKIGYLEADQEMKELVQKEETKMLNYRKYIKICMQGDILAVSFFCGKELFEHHKEPEVIVFINKKEKQYISYFPSERKWRTATIQNIMSSFYGISYFCTSKEWKTFIEYFSDQLKWKNTPNVNSIKSIINDFQWNILDEKREENYRKETSKWDQVMSKIPHLPKDWEKWCRRTAITQHYIFYRTVGKSKQGYCSRCGSSMTLRSPKHNQYGICPRCKKKIQYKSIGRQKSIYNKPEYAYLLQKFGDNQMVIRNFEVRAWFYQSQGFIPDIEWVETRRVIVNPDFSQTAYYYGRYKDDSYRWRESLYAYYHYGFETYKGALYQRTLYFLNKGILKTSGLYEFQKNVSRVEPETYLLYRNFQPGIEKIAKAGLKQLVIDEIIKRKRLPDRKKLVEILELDRHLLKQLVHIDGGIYSLSWLQQVKSSQKVLPLEVIQYFEKYKICPGDIAFIDKQMTAIQVYHYLCRMEKECGKSAGEILRIWKDYLAMAKRLGKDPEDAIIYRPRDLIRRHDEAVKMLQEIDTEEKAKEWRKQFPDLERVCKEITFTYQYMKDKNFAILVPQKIEEMVTEGKTLHHCVGAEEIYFKKICKKKSYIVFLRRKENLEKVFYTLEITTEGDILQNSKEYNRVEKDYEEAIPFLKKWKKVVQKKLEKQHTGFSEIRQNEIAA